MDYTVCSTVIKLSTEKSKYLTDFLFPLAATNCPHHILKNDKILESYGHVANEIITLWLELMNKHDCFKELGCDDEPIFIKTCQKSYDKILIVSNKNDIENAQLTWINLNILDADEAISETEKQHHITHIHQNWEHAQAVWNGSISNI